jgi:hypothetical protein
MFQWIEKAVKGEIQKFNWQTDLDRLKFGRKLRKFDARAIFAITQYKIAMLPSRLNKRGKLLKAKLRDF